MIVPRCFTPSTMLVVLTLLSGFDKNAAERWSRQVSSSEWIPLTNPRSASGPSNAGSGPLPGGTHLSKNPIQSLALPPPLQQQYQEQLIQLQKTQESIQKLLLLQQQLRAQQQVLQSQTFLPSGFSNVEDEKQELLPSSLGNLQTAPDLLVPPQTSSETLPIYPPQNFLPQRPGQVHQQSHRDQNLEANRELPSLPVQGQVVLQHSEDVNVEDPREGPHSYVTKQGGHSPGRKRPRIQSNSELSQLPLIESTGRDEEEEVQLVYVPAETLAQKGQQSKRVRGRKPYHLHQQQHQQQRENQDDIEQAPLSADQEAFARQVLQQIQKEHEEKAQFLKEERVKEFARLNEEQKVLERKTRLQQEALQREQELLRQKEAEKKRKELERLEEMARQRELERIREAREKQRQEELERRRLAELRIKEEKRREEEARQKQVNLEQALKQQQSTLGSQQEHHLRPTSSSLTQLQENEQARRQQHTDGTRLKRIRGRQRQRINQYQEQPNYPEATTTPSPNQPPLSVYMGTSTSKLEAVKVTDVLRILRNAKTIAVLDNVGPDTPRVFVGPSNLDPPYGYAKFDLPYLSSIDHNRVERKVDKLPFFVAPLSFEPPPGYSKIPFPAPHIGSVVVNTLSEASPEPVTPPTEQNPNPTPLIEPNSYSEIDQIAGSVATTASYESPITQSFSPESSGPKYESTYSTPPSGSRFRFKQYYDNKPTSVVSSSYYSEQPTTKAKPRIKQYYEQESKSTTQSPKVDNTPSYRQEVLYSNAPNFQDRTIGSHDPSTKEQDLEAQLALINQELAQQREPQRYNTAPQYRPQANLAETYDVNDVRAPVGPTQYNLPAELPPISPHLPGLVNSLLDKQERNLPATSTPPPTTTTTPVTTTTTRVSSTTYRPRGRNRVVPTRAKTTTTPSSRTNTDRARRPYNRSKSRFSTTTEDYHESSYEPTKAKTPETTQKYKTVEPRRPTSKTHKYRSRDRTSSQSAIHDRNSNIQAHQAAIYENYPVQSDSQTNASPDTYSLTNEPASNLQKDISHEAVNDFTRESYLPTTPTQTENYPPLREVTVQHGAKALVSDDYSRSQNYPQNQPQEALYHGGLEQLEKTPVNGFNYEVGNEQSPDQAIPQRAEEYPRYQVKLENANYNLATTEDPRIRPGEEQQYSPVYEVNMGQPQPQDYNTDGQNLIRDQILPSDDGKIESGVIKTDQNVQPIFIPLQHNKQEDYELHIPSTQTPLIEATTTSTTTPASVIIRQRVRGRLGSRGHHDSTIQTRPRGSQDEYVRFSAVNHDSNRGTGYRPREGSRTRTRARPQSHGSQVQTEGNEYIKIHAAQQQRLIATTTPPTTTTILTTSVHPLEEDIDYGFIRPPSFQPVHPVHQVDNRFQMPITYRPPLSEIQHIISNDEAAVESSPAHVLRNRPKYQQTPSRRPATKTLATTTPSTTTEAVPIETTVLNNPAYTVQPKTRLQDSSKTTNVRGRIRRPGKKRVTTTTTTTESVLEANNELPLDENYPQITPQQFVAVTETGQRTLYEENFEIPSQYVPSQNRPVQLYEETTGENYPPQEFILNFDNLPEQVSQREKYDQSQLASIPSKKYSHSSRVNPTEDANAHSTGDIYGSESQWSTKLSRTSFQPSFASNRAANDAKRGRGKIRDDRNDENAPEIITAGPDMSFVTIMVSSDYQKGTDGAGDVETIIDSSVFGKKTNAQEDTDKLNATTAVTSSPITTLRDVIPIEDNTSSEARDWGRSKESNVAKPADDFAHTTKKVTDPLPSKKGGTRRRRVRVRVRPAVDDFVTSESQHFNSAVNNLLQDRYKYNPIRESKFTTIQPIATTITTTATPTTQKSLLQDFLEEMLKNGEVSNPTHVTPIPTEFPVSTMSMPITTTYYSDNDETTTLKENHTPIVMTVTPSNPDNEHTTTTNESSEESKNEPDRTTSLYPEQIPQMSQEEIKDATKVNSEEYRTENSQKDNFNPNDLENISIIEQRYKLPLNYPSGAGTSKQVEDGFKTGLPATRDKGKEHIMTLKKPEENIEENEAHPKNHRAKWSEVRYPSTFHNSQSTVKQYSTTSVPGFTTRNEGEASLKTLSDYVAAIFDSMKTVDGRGEEKEEIAKVVETKNESSAENSYRYNDIVEIREIGAKETEKSALKITTTTDSSQDAYTIQSVNPRESTTSPPEAQTATDMTTKESATTLESTTPISDTTVNAIITSEEIATTKTSTTTTSTEKTTTPLGRSADNVDRANSTMTMLGKILRTSTTTRVSHMTEICYRGRCVMTKPKMEDATR